MARRSVGNKRTQSSSQENKKNVVEKEEAVTPDPEELDEIEDNSNDGSNNLRRSKRTSRPTMARQQMNNSTATTEDDDDDESKENEEEEEEEDDDFVKDADEEEEDDFKPVAKKRRSAASGTSTSNVPIRTDRTAKLAFPKGSFVLRLSDQEPDEEGNENRNKNHIWRIDNHQLLQKYERISTEDNTKYAKTNRYSGWQCEEDWKFMALHVKEKTQGDNEVTLKSYPTQEQINTAMDKMREHDGTESDGDEEEEEEEDEGVGEEGDDDGDE